MELPQKSVLLLYGHFDLLVGERNHHFKQDTQWMGPSVRPKPVIENVSNS